MNKKLANELNRTKDQLQTTNQDMMRLQKKSMNNMLALHTSLLKFQTPMANFTS